MLVKGGDYDPEASKGERGFIVGSEEVRERGGRVEVIPLVPGRSTTNIIKKADRIDRLFSLRVQGNQTSSSSMNFVVKSPCGSGRGA